MTVLYVTHDQEEAMNLSDRVAIMSGVRVAQIGAPRDVHEHPANGFTARFLGEANLLGGTVAMRAGELATFRLAEGTTLEGGRSGELAAGTAGQLFVRPEKLSIRPPGMPAAAMANRLGGTVRRASFLGNIVRYAVERAGGALVTVDAPNLSSGHHTGPGDAVTLDWSPADSAILSSDAP